MVTLGDTATKTIRRRLTPLLAALLLILLILPACLADTCSGGQNMTNPRVLGEFSATSSTPSLRIGWDAGTELGAALTDEYFKGVLVSPGGDGALIETVAYTSERELTVVFSSLEESLAERNALSFTLEFPDRARHTDCNHGGMRDRYFLDVSLLFDEFGTLESTDFTQNVAYGPY